MALAFAVASPLAIGAASVMTAGSVNADTSGGGNGGSSNAPTDDTTYTTKWVDESGDGLEPPESSTDGYEPEKEFTDYTFDKITTDESTHTKTYVYKSNKVMTADTSWVDEDGNTLKSKASGTFPDNDGKSDIDGYAIVSAKTQTDNDGNTHMVNTYHKIKQDTTWVDTNSKVLKDEVDGAFPDNDGKSDIVGYNLVSVKTDTDKNGDKHIINTYQKPAVQTHTTWVDTDGKTLKPQQSGSLPDTMHDAVTGYSWVSTTTDENGNTINIYKTTVTSNPEKSNTYWFDTKGNKLKDEAVGQTLPDTDHNDIPNYTWQSTYTVTAADLKEGGTFYGSGFGEGDTINIYKKGRTPKLHTTWVNESGKTLKPQEDGAHPDNDGKSDIKGYTLVRTDTDADGNVTNVYTKKVHKDGGPNHRGGHKTPKLPKTGTDTSAASVLSTAGLSLLGALGLGGFKAQNSKRRRKTRKAQN